jgi:uncharacterized RDD family membrane protein YckC
MGGVLPHADKEGNRVSIVQKRLMSAIIDYGLFCLITAILTSGYLSLIENNNLEGFIFVLLISLVLFLTYTTIDEFYSGQTIGKRIMKIQLISKENHKLLLRHSLIRNLTRTVDYIAGTGVILLLFTNKRLGDFLSGTEIIEKIDSQQSANVSRKTIIEEFRTFLNICIIIFLLLCLMIGSIAFVFSFFAEDYKSDWFNVEGVQAGVLSLLISPMIGVMWGIIMSVSFFIPYLMIKKMFYRL